MGLGTPSNVVEAITKRVDEHLKSSKMEFSGNRDIVFKEITETMPIRMVILVAVQMTHTGETARFLFLFLPMGSSFEAFAIRVTLYCMCKEPSFWLAGQSSALV